MEFVKTEKRFSLYVDGTAAHVPQYPTDYGDLIHYQDNMDIHIGRICPGKELTWHLFRDGDRTIWLCDRNLVNFISRSECDALVRQVEIEGMQFHQELPYAGCGTTNSFGNSDWGRIIKLIPYADTILYTHKCYSHTSDTCESDKKEWAILVGYDNAKTWYHMEKKRATDNVGWRPVLIGTNGSNGKSVDVNDRKETEDIDTHVKVRLAEQIIHSMALLPTAWSEKEIQQIVEDCGIPSFSKYDIQVARKVDDDGTVAFLKKSINKGIKAIQQQDNRNELFLKHILPLIRSLEQREADLKKTVEKDYSTKTKFY